MRVAICDDEKMWQDNLLTKLESFYGKLDMECQLFFSGEELLDMVKQGKDFDVFFLDIEMPKLDGIGTAKELRRLGINSPLVFLTSHTEMAMEGYEVAAFRFLAKPIVEEKLMKALSDIEKMIYEKKSILLKQEGEEYVVEISKIIYVEAQNNSVRFVCEDHEYTCRMKISDAYEKLCEIQPIFSRVHRGYIVSLSHVKKQKQNDIYMSDGSVLTISRSYAKEFREQLMEFIRKNAR